jgi:hypothetical protein
MLTSHTTPSSEPLTHSAASKPNEHALALPRQPNDGAVNVNRPVTRLFARTVSQLYVAHFAKPFKACKKMFALMHKRLYKTLKTALENHAKPQADSQEYQAALQAQVIVQEEEHRMKAAAARKAAATTELPTPSSAPMLEQCKADVQALAFTKQVHFDNFCSEVPVGRSPTSRKAQVQQVAATKLPTPSPAPLFEQCKADVQALAFTKQVHFDSFCSEVPVARSPTSHKAQVQQVAATKQSTQLAILEQKQRKPNAKAADSKALVQIPASNPFGQQATSKLPVQTVDPESPIQSAAPLYEQCPAEFEPLAFTHQFSTSLRCFELPIAADIMNIINLFQIKDEPEDREEMTLNQITMTFEPDFMFPEQDDFEPEAREQDNSFLKQYPVLVVLSGLWLVGVGSIYLYSLIHKYFTQRAMRRKRALIQARVDAFVNAEIVLYSNFIRRKCPQASEEQIAKTAKAFFRYIQRYLLSKIRTNSYEKGCIQCLLPVCAEALSTAYGRSDETADCGHSPGSTADGGLYRIPSSPPTGRVRAGRRCAEPRQEQRVHGMSLSVVSPTKLATLIKYQTLLQESFSDSTFTFRFNIIILGVCSMVGVFPLLQEFLFFNSSVAERLTFEANCAAHH